MYAKGAKWERIVRSYFEGIGCLVVRSAGSKGLVDLVVIKSCYGPSSEHVLFVQCKTDLKRLSRTDRTNLIRLGLKYNCAAILAYPKYGFNSKKADNMVLEELTLGISA